MSEQLGFKDQINTLRNRLMGKSALVIDEELRLAYRGGLIDPATGQNLHPDYVPLQHGMYVDHDEQENFLDNDWEFHDQDARSKDCWMERVEATPIIVDEYGHETCFEPTEPQIERLASKTGESAILLQQRIAQENFYLAQEGRRAINTAELRDEYAIKKLLEKDNKGCDARARVSAQVSLVVSAGEYSAGQSRQVVIDSKEAYASQQKVINQTMNHDAEAKT